MSIQKRGSIYGGSRATPVTTESVKLNEASGRLRGLWWWAGLDGRGWLVDLHLGGQGLRLRAAAAEQLRVRPVGGLEGGGAAGLDVGLGAVVDGRGAVHRDAGMPVSGVVVGEECLAEDVRVLDGSEFAGERGAVLEGLELRL